MQMTSACQNAAHAAHSALLAQADHVAISCPENPRSFFFFFLIYLFTRGSSATTRTEDSFLHLCLMQIHNVSLSGMMLIKLIFGQTFRNISLLRTT